MNSKLLWQTSVPLLNMFLGLGSTVWASDSPAPIDPPNSGIPIAWKIRGDFDGLFASDIRLTQTGIGASAQKGRFDVTTSIAYNLYDFDYQPAPDIDFLGYPSKVQEHRIAGQISSKIILTDSLKGLIGGGAYDGYNDYRSAWLNEYYRQQFSDVHNFGSEYVKPEPGGQNLNAGLRWEYLPTTGFVQADFTYLHDQIAPGYEIDFDGLRRGRENLYTGLYHVSFENVLTRRIRLMNEFRLTDTTNRKLRYNYQGSINISIADPWVVRATGGYTQENPQFQAHFVGGIVEYQAISGWWISASGRYYRDTGEIENSLFSSAAPGLTAWQAGLGIRHAWGGQSIKLTAAPYFTRYDEIGINTAAFQNLYKKRTWFSVQLAYQYEF